MRVLSVASECLPLIKTGGLADVVGALPAALAGVGVEMRVLLPGYPAVMAALEDGPREVLAEGDLFGGPGRVLAGKARGLDALVLEADHLFGRAGAIYLDELGRDWADNPERFAALSWAAARIAAAGADGWVPQVLHAHDWQGGLAPWYLRQMGAAGRVASVLTVHNVAFPGLAPAERRESLRLDPAGFQPQGYEFHGRISALKAGLKAADRITTVSPTYARELTRPEFGMGFDGVFRAREADLVGILNGIDTGVWDPAADPHVETYSTPRGKARARRALIGECGLDPSAPGPLCVVVSRLTAQKGMDVLLSALPALLDLGGQLALIGAGEREIEQALVAAAGASPRVHVRIGYDEGFAHRLIAGGDAILVPSRFEPCGLTQLCGLRYGAVPVVARTGGLADTVIHANAAARAADVATGLEVWPLSADALAHALRDLVTLHADEAGFARMQRNGMRHPVGWERSAGLYKALYSQIVPTA